MNLDVVGNVAGIGRWHRGCRWSRGCAAAVYRSASFLLIPVVRIGIEARMQGLFGYHSRRHDGQGETAAEVPSAAGIVREVVLHVGHHVGMAGTRHIVELQVILTLEIAVPEYDGERRTGGVTVVRAADNLGPVRLLAGCGALAAGSPAGYVGGEILLVDGEILRNSVDGDANRRAMRFAEYGNLEKLSETVHVRSF